jgi:aspartyl-tRNA(Asn)/glutamyl-tRNA(Gln) amidotransferase subunit A
MIPDLSLLPGFDRTIAGVGRLMRGRERTSVDVVEECLGRIDAWESKVNAWVVVDREGALAQAAERDRELADGKDRGPLHGIPLGIKDIVDVRGLPTAGAPALGNQIAQCDATVVSYLREAGAVILGKTVTTPYAWIDPPPTSNPWDLERTPGGSSSGSAASLASGMCLGSLGTQTGGSITRPAAFCGVASYKPSYGMLNTYGILPLAKSLDTPGAMARTVGDLEILQRGMRKLEEKPPAPSPWDDPSFKPCLKQLRGFFDEHADEVMREAVDDVAEVVMDAGAQVFELDGLERFREIRRCHRIIMAAEAAGEHRARRGQQPEAYPEEITALIDEGSMILAVDYLDAKRQQSELGHWQQCLMDRPHGYIADALVLPAAIGPAPGRSSTGDPIFNSPWTFSGQPTISIPVGLSPEGLPLSIQLVGLRHNDDALFRVARWIEDVLGRARS